MLELKFKNLVTEIIKVCNQHKESADPNSFYSNNWEFIFSEYDGWIVLFCLTKKERYGYWVYPLLYPTHKINTIKKSLPHFNIFPPSAGYGKVIGDKQNWIQPYWGSSNNMFDSEIPLFFQRLYYGNPRGKESYFEFNQLVTHVLNLHWSADKTSYCVIDDYGEEIEKIKLIDYKSVELILIRRKTLEKLLYLGNWYLIRYFDFSRFMDEKFIEFNTCTTEVRESKKFEAKYEIRKKVDKFIEFRGAEIFRPKTPQNSLLGWNIEDPNEEPKKYANFIIWDWKNGKLLKDYSLEPKNFSNYFEKSDLPFETSPIFFKAEVLDKYKNNLLKYELTERSISCRGGWYLQTYDINEYNQVHTYAIYLARLPFKEQLHWLQYNEEPKGGISKRAFQTDFEGEFSDQISNIEQLKHCLNKHKKVKIGRETYSIWLPKTGEWESTTKGLHQVTTENPNQWHDFIISLNNVTNEGFQIKSLRKIASKYGEIDINLKALGLIKFILIESGNESLIPSIHGTLSDLQVSRSKGKAHGEWYTPTGSLMDDANKRLSDVIYAMEKLFTVLESMELPGEE